MSDKTSGTAEVTICFCLLDGCPMVGEYHTDDEGYRYCVNGEIDQMVGMPDGHPIQNIDEYRFTTLTMPLNDIPGIIADLNERMCDACDDHEDDWKEQAKASIAVWEAEFGQTERHTW